MLAFITGTGFYTLPGLTDTDQRTVPTPFGDVTVTRGLLAGEEVAFIPRHGADHSVPPHRINYRANIAALSEIGAGAIIATAVSGSLHREVGPGSLRLVDQFIDLTWGRPLTFFDHEVRHTDMTHPYHQGLRGALLEAAQAAGVEILPTATYVCFNGPRFETPAEIRMAATMGGDLVGMTGCPEVVLANELGIPYASIGVVSNLCAGMEDQPLSVREIMAILENTAEPLQRLIGAALPALVAVAADSKVSMVQTKKDRR